MLWAQSDENTLWMTMHEASCQNVTGIPPLLSSFLVRGQNQQERFHNFREWQTVWWLQGTPCTMISMMA